MRVLAEETRIRDVLEGYIRELAATRPMLKILEAGCGRKWYFGMNGIRYELTGVDLDGAALEARMKREADLHHAIVGDLRTVELEPQSFDVIYNAYVLEHIPNAETVLRRFVEWLKPGGLLIITVPDRDSVHGLMTRLLPFQAHVLYYRWAWGLKEAGKPGFAPYRTYYDPVISVRGLRDFAARHGLKMLDEVGYGSYARGRPLFKALTPLFARTVSALSLGRAHSRFVDLAYVLQRAS
jgi:SAM-dependent methyltransferase